MIDPFLKHRPLLFSIAYRMLGSVAEAEDAVQDTFLRWQRVTEKQEEIRSSKAWLVSTVTRLSIDRLRSAQRRREQYVGVWLPEPLMATTIDSHNQDGALADSISTAFMVMLETLTPEERAVFILREAFDYSHNEISAIVGKSEANCRQIARRAKEHLSQPARRRPIDPVQAETLVQQFSLGLSRWRRRELDDSSSRRFYAHVRRWRSRAGCAAADSGSRAHCSIPVRDSEECYNRNTFEPIKQVM